MKYTLVLLFSYGLLYHSSSWAQSFPVSDTYSSSAVYPELKIERGFVYEPKTNWLYSHHPYIWYFKGKFIAIWSNGHKDEDQPGQRVAIASSKDGLHWSTPEVLASPGNYKGDTLNVLTAAGFHEYQGTLVAYYGEYSPNRTHTMLWAKTSRDGKHWSAPLSMGIPVNPNHGPQPTLSGRLIICGNFSFPYTDDKAGLKGWKMTSFYPDSLYKEDNPASFYAPAKAMGLPALCEGAFYETDDSVIQMLLRVTGKDWKGKLWLTESKDNGAHWSRPVESGFTDNDSKFHLGRLPNGLFYYVGIPDTLHHYARTPLVLATSRDGKRFDRHYIIASQPYQLQQEGLWKGGQYGYPHSFIKGRYMYIIISRQKEAIEVLRFNINQLSPH
ncbi:MAG TPA: exo-alpha-sialidase [Chitinophagaceae bacterium]|nr:exo-alpha-sialidase [Chitinophagaceae bacterium]